MSWSKADKSTVWSAMPSFSMARVNVLPLKLNVSIVWVSVPLLSRSDKSTVWLVPPVMPTVSTLVELLKANPSMSCSSVSVSILDKSSVWVLPPLMDMVILFVFKLAVKVWLSVLESPDKVDRSSVIVFPLVIDSVMVLLALRADADKLCSPVTGWAIQVEPPPVL